MRGRVGGVVAACVGALVLATGAVFAMQQISGGGPGIFAIPASAPGPDDDWRAEYYRDIRFDVPKSWGYAFEPGPDWCVAAEDEGGTLGRPEPYVSLGAPDAVALILCNAPTAPASHWQEHVAVVPADSLFEAGWEDGEEEFDGWWRIQKQVNGVLVRVVSKDRELAESVIATARPSIDDESGCQPTSEVQRGIDARPSEPFDVEKLGTVDEITVCQYDTDDRDYGPGLRARARLNGADVAAAVAAIKAATPNTKTTCASGRYERESFMVAVVVWLKSGDESHQLYLAIRGCPNGHEASLGGFDDGTTIRSITKATCQPLFVPPILFQGGSRDVWERCRR